MNGNVKNKSSMELENKIKCVLMDFEINEITLQEATKQILLLFDVVGRSEQLHVEKACKCEGKNTFNRLQCPKCKTL